MDLRHLDYNYGDFDVKHLFSLSVPVVNFDPVSNIPRRGAREEYPCDAKLLQPRDIVLPNDVAGDDDDIRSL